MQENSTLSYVWQRLVSSVLEENLKEWGLKEAMLMINLIGLLAAQLQRHSQEVSVSLSVDLSLQDQGRGA